jgi:hypothetical protein
LPPDGARNVSEWIIGHLRQPVRGGESLERPGLRALVRKVRRQKVLEAQIEPAAQTTGVPNDAHSDTSPPAS